MRRIRLGGQGVNMWTPADRRNVVPPPQRSEIKGWTKGAARRNKLFLMSVDPVEVSKDLTYAVTLTLPETPPTSGDWSKIVDRFLTIMRRAGMVRYHWVTEWTKRGRPHLHATIAFAGLAPVNPVTFSMSRLIPDARLLLKDRAIGQYSLLFESENTDFVREWRHRKIIGPAGASKVGKAPNSYADQLTDQVVADAVFDAWKAACKDLIPSERAQHVERVNQLSGWAAYVAKHAGRGVDHYQRENDKLPEGWASSGRLWSRGGDWPVRNDNLSIDPVTFFRYRRVLRRWQRSKVLQKIDRYYGKPKAQAVKELHWLQKANNRRPKDHGTVSHDIGYKPRRVATSDVSGLVSFADRAMLDVLFAWAMDHPESECWDAETGEILVSPGAPPDPRLVPF
jgi:hypothetical protein